MLCRRRKYASTRTALALLGFASVVAVDIPVPAAEAQDQARPKIAEAKELEAGTARIFKAIERNIERRHELAFTDLTANVLACHDKYSSQIEAVPCEKRWKVVPEN
jgi:hypothetical protein